MHFLKFIVFMIALCSVEYYKVLVVFCIPVKSLNSLGEAYVNYLLNAGHEVTYISAVPSKRNFGPKFRQIDVSSLFDLMTDSDILNITAIMEGKVEMNDIRELQEYSVQYGDHVFGKEAVKILLENNNEKFDLVIADLIETELFSAFSAVFECPMIWAYSMGAHWNVLRLVNEPHTSPAYTVDYLSSNIPPLSFKQRLQELWAKIHWTWVKKTNTLSMEEAIYKEHIGPIMAKRGKKLPNYEDVIFNVSLIFSNEHHALGAVPSIPPNFKLIGGLHIETPAKLLPQNLQTLMDNSKHGVIYFSMGSLWQSKDIPMSVTLGLLKMFGELKETVIWKYEADLENVPKNVHILKWAPQPSILAHPKCLLFISHGGLLSSTEALHFGVPIIGVPVYFDQFVNVNKAMSKGFALRVPLTFNLPQDLKVAIQTMVNDPKFGQRSKELSAIYHDRPISPGKEMVHWVEHVIKTGGAPHLKSPSYYAETYQIFYLDLAVLILVAITAICVGIKKILSGNSSIKNKKRKTH